MTKGKIELITVDADKLVFWRDNPRIAYSGLPADATENDIVNYYFEHQEAGVILRAMSAIGVSPIEPILGFKNYEGQFVCEGGRRIAAIKALNDPSIIHNLETREKVQELRAMMSKEVHQKVKQAYVLNHEHASIFSTNVTMKIAKEMFA